MKNISKLFMLALLMFSIGFTSCEEGELPYPIDEVEHGVLLSVNRTADSEAFIDALDPDMPNPLLEVEVEQVPFGEGDFDHYDIVVIYNNFAAGTFAKHILEEGVTTLPYKTNIDYPALLTALGIDREDPGDVFTVVLDIKLPSGLIAYGWTPFTGFTNSEFASWRDATGANYSRRVQFPAACPISEDTWVGSSYLHRTNAAGSWVFEGEEAFIELLDEDDRPEGMEEADLTGFSLHRFFLDDENDGLWDGTTESMLKFWINNTTFEVIIPDQGIVVTWDIGAALGGASDFHEIIMEDFGNLELNSCLGELKFSAAMTIGTSGYWFGIHTFTVIPEFFLDDKSHDEFMSIMDAMQSLERKN